MSLPCFILELRRDWLAAGFSLDNLDALLVAAYGA